MPFEGAVFASTGALTLLSLLAPASTIMMLPVKARMLGLVGKRGPGRPFHSESRSRLPSAKERGQGAKERAEGQGREKSRGSGQGQ